MKTILFQNGKIIDGSGDPAFSGSLLIEGDKIKKIIKKGEELPKAETVIDCENHVISPGFIDMHSHSEWVLLLDNHPEILSCLLEQGVTTVIGGNCGISPAPVSSDSVENLERLASIGIVEKFDYSWSSMGEFLKHMDGAKPVLNMAELVGHAAIRYKNVKTLRGDLTEEELENCLLETEKAFDEGACGLSLGLGYDPGMYSSIYELTKFCEVAAKKGKPVAVHLKAMSKLSPGYPELIFTKPHNIRALKEILDIAEKTGVKLQISHFIFVGRKTWKTVNKCIGMVEDAQKRGVDVMFDAFPYTCGNTTIVVPLPFWFIAGIPESYNSFMAKLRLRIELLAGFFLVGFSYKDLQIMDSVVPGWENLNGLRLTEVAKIWKMSPFKAMLRLAEKSNGAALVLFHSYSGEPFNESVIEKVLSHESCLFETDVIIKKSGYPNPASRGTFPKILGDFVRKRKLFTLENGIKRMSSESAKRFGLNDIGILKAGKNADVVVFNPDTISDDSPAGNEPVGKPKGINHVFVNGLHTVKNGEYIAGVRAGRVLR